MSNDLLTFFLLLVGVLVIAFLVYNSSILTQPTQSPTLSPSSTSSSSPSSSSSSSSTTSSRPFKLGINKNTRTPDLDGQLSGSGSTIYLDRHFLNCENNAINRLRLLNIGQTNFVQTDKNMYDYTCTSEGSLDTTKVYKATTPDTNGNGQIRFLDRHNIICDNNSVLSDLKLVNNGGNLQYQYNCLKSTKPLSCRKLFTEFSTAGTDKYKQTTYLFDRHLIKCNDNEAISQINLVNKPGLDGNTDNDQFRFEYTCCSTT